MAGVISASTAITAATAAMSVAGTAASAAGKYKGGVAQTQKETAVDLYRAQVARNLARGYRDAGDRAVAGGVVASDIEGLRTRANFGGARAKQAASGIDVDSASARDVREGVREAGRLNQLTTLSNAQLQGWGYRTKAVEQDAQAALSQAGAATAGTAQEGAAMAATGSLIGAASSLPFNWVYKQFATPSTTPAEAVANGTQPV